LNRGLPDTPQKVYTVSELTLEIKDLLEHGFQHLWVEGEISNCRLHGSGHLYLTLKDQNSQIRAVMFRSQVRQMAFQPEDGMHVLCLGRIGVYEPRGEYQLYVDFMEPKGLGALQMAFEQLKARLEAEGLFDRTRKRPLPFLPRKIGIVTSPTGAVIRDMLQILGRRFPELHILIRPVRVQGEGAAEEIVQGLEDLNGVPGLDLIVLARGGGSLEDLWAFNEEQVARAIVRSRVPVVSAVGHEVDFTIADFAADLRAPTPSAAAELIVPVRRELQEDISDLRGSLLQAMGRVLQGCRQEAEAWAQRLRDPRRRVADHRLLLDDLQGRLIASMGQTVARARDGLLHQGALLLRADPRKRGDAARREVGVWWERLERSMAAILQGTRRGIEQQTALLDSLSPLNVLARGYSITRRIPTDEIVREARTLRSGERLRITFHRGEATCRVESRSQRRTPGSS
jgi:exodeoxyribonuclease VII large subunit